MADMDIPSNSHKSQEAQEQGANQKPPVPEFQGQTAGIKRKNGNAAWKWFKRLFLSGRSPKEIAKEVFETTIVPSMQDNFRNGAMAMLDGFIYKNSSPGVKNSRNGVSYNKIYSGQQSRPSPQPAPQQTNSQQEEINKGFNNPCFHTQMDAMNFLNMMKGYDYPTLSVHTMYMMQKKHIDYTWDAYGWTREEIAALGTNRIRRIGNAEWPYMIDLPEAHVIA